MKTSPDLEQGRRLHTMRLAVPWQIFWLICVTWVPLLILTLANGRALGPTPELSFLRDIATHVRFLVAIPLLILGGDILEKRIGVAARSFVTADLVVPEDVASVDRATRRMGQLYHSTVIATLLLALAVLGSWVAEHQQILSRGPRPSWGVGDAAAVFAARAWFLYVSIPIFQYFMYRWAWRLAVWSWFLLRISRLRLTLVPTHPDRVGGLGFLRATQWGWALTVFPFGCVLSGFAAFQIMYQGAVPQDFELSFIAYLLIAETLVLFPLLPFAPLLAKTKREGLLRYGEFADLYVERFDKKWLVPKENLPDSPLGSSDIQSLADLGNSFAIIETMRMAPFDRRLTISVALLTALPMLPLFLLVYPVTEVVQLIAGILLKG